MNFAVLGKNTQISKKELNLLNLFNIKQVHTNIILFDSHDYNLISKIGGITKYGQLININDLNNLHINLLGINNNKIGATLKRKLGIKRYKLTEIINTDLEIKNDGIELIAVDGINDESILMVQGYQNIDVFEQIDFAKPYSGMEIGMMPSKLTQILINIGISFVKNKKYDEITVYDPFVGFGTSGFIANYLGLDFIGSDINVTQFKSNIKWRNNNKYYNKNKRIIEFKHNIYNNFNKNFLNNVDLIVTEGWLGPIIKSNIPENQFLENIEKIFGIYNAFIINCNQYFKNVVLCFTIPVYLQYTNLILEKITNIIPNTSYKLDLISEIYKRPGQKIGRQIIILN